MIRSKAFLAGLSGSALFIITTILGGFLHPGYNHITQFISELYAQGAPGADMLKYAGYIPSGVFIAFFSVYAIKELPKSPLSLGGFAIIGIFYGIGTVLAGLFPCDEGCNPQYIDPSISQLLHNLIGFLTYITVPFALLILGISAGKWKNAEKLSYLAYFCGLLSVSFVYLLFSGDSAPYTGLFQRIIELSILTWIIACSFYLNNKKKQ